MFWVLISTVHLTVYFCHVTYAFQSEYTIYSCLNVKEFFAWRRREIWSLSDSNWTGTLNYLVRKWALNHLTGLAKFSAVFWVLICTVHLTVCSRHVTYAFQSGSRLYSCLNIEELHAWSKHEIWYLSYCHWTRTQNHLARKPTLNHFAKLAKWLSCVLSTYVQAAFDCMFLSCHVRLPEWIQTLSLPQSQGTPSSKQTQNLKFNWLQLDSNP